MKITFTLNVDGGVEDVASLLRWVDATYNQAHITIDVPELIDSSAHVRDAFVSTGIVETIESHERARRRADRRQVELANYDQHVSIECPLCHAQPLQGCITAHGRPAKRVHSVRRWEATYGPETQDAYIDRVIREDAVATSPQTIDLRRADWANYCMCSHTEAVHLSDRHNTACTTAMCDCPSFTAVAPFPPVTLDEM